MTGDAEDNPATSEGDTHMKENLPQGKNKGKTTGSKNKTPRPSCRGVLSLNLSGQQLQEVLSVPQLVHPEPKSILQSSLKPYI